MNSFIPDVFQMLMLIFIIVLGYYTLNLMMEIKTSKRFLLKKGFEDPNEAEDSNVLKKQVTFLERLTSFSKYKSYLEKEIADSRLDISVNRFLLKRFIMAFIMMLLMLILYQVSKINLFLYLSIPVAILAYKLPKKQLTSAKKYFEQQLKLELVEYLSAFAVLLKSYTPYDATRLSLEYAGPFLKKHVENLITQIDLYPVSQKPYNDFASAINLREAKEFMVALQQMMNVDAKMANEIINDQITIMNQLEEQAYDELIEERPDEVERYINPMLFPLVAIFFTFLFILIKDAFTSII